MVFWVSSGYGKGRGFYPAALPAPFTVLSITGKSPLKFPSLRKRRVYILRFFRQNLQTLLALKKFRHGKDRSFHTAVFLTPFTLLIISQKSLQKVCTFGVDKNLLPSFPYTRQSPHDTEFTQKEMKPQPFVPGIFPSFIIFIIFQTGFQINFFIFTRGSGRGFRGERVPMALTPNKQHVREKRKSAPWHFLWRFSRKNAMLARPEPGFRTLCRLRRFSPQNLPVFLLPGRRFRTVQNQLSSGPSLCRKVLLHLSGHVFFIELFQKFPQRPL